MAMINVDVRGASATRRRSAQEWRTLIRAHSRGNETRKHFCARHGVALSTFERWRRRVRSEMPDSDSASRPLRAARDSTPSLFVELAPEANPIIASSSAWDVELDLGAGMVLRLRRSSC